MNYCLARREAFPDMWGLSPRSLKYMRSFAAAWSDRQIVQEVLAQITWYHNIAMLEKVANPQVCLWYARKAREEGWSHNVLVMQIETLERSVKSLAQARDLLLQRLMNEEVMAYLQAKLNTALIPHARGRDERLELPEDALREALVNAIAHCDYRSTANVQVYVFYDRI